MCVCMLCTQRYFLTGIFPQELLLSDEDILLKRVVLFFTQYKEEKILILVHGHDCVHKPTEYTDLLDVLNDFVVKMFLLTYFTLLFVKQKVWSNVPRVRLNPVLLTSFLKQNVTQSFILWSILDTKSTLFSFTEESLVFLQTQIHPVSILIY